MSKKNKKIKKASFPISAKIILISSIIIIVTLAVVTLLDIGLFKKDIVLAAEETNKEINNKLAHEAYSLLSNARSGSRMFVQTSSLQQQNLFWEDNPNIAAICHTVSGRQQLYINKRFFSFRGITEGLVPVYFDGQKTVLNRAEGGKTTLQSASSFFSRSMLTLFYPLQNKEAVGVLFFPDTLNFSFESAQHQSFMINTDGNLLCHEDASLVRKGTNAASLSFIQSILNDQIKESGQFFTESGFGVMRLEFNPVDIDMRVWKMIKTTAVFLYNKSREFLAKYDIFILKPKEEKITRAFTAFSKLNSFDAVVITSIDNGEIYREIFAVIRRNIYLAIALIIISSVFINMFSKTLSVPLGSMLFASKQIEKGNFRHNFDIKNRDEIGMLAHKFKKMCGALDIFFRFTSREISVKMINGDIKPGGITKHCSILYSRIRDFSLKLEHFSQVFGFEASGKVINWLNNYFSQMIDCVEKTEGTMDKFAGDAVIAYWGAAGSAGSPRKDAFNCIKAALMMRKAVFFLNKERKAGDPESPALYFGCGVNTGTVAAGQVGSEKFMQYTAIGDNVGIAYEMEELAMQHGVDILISEDTWRLVGDLFFTEELPAVKIKGKEKPVRLFAVINFTGEIKGPQSIDEVRSIMGIESSAQELEEL